MTFPTSHESPALAAVLDALRALEAGAAAAADAAGADARGSDAPGSDARGLSEAQLQVRLLAELGVARAALERVALRGIAALDRACVLDPETDPVRAAGHRDVGSLLAELWRTSLPNARQLCAVARATAPRHTLHGEVLPPAFPELAAALLGDPATPASGDDPETRSAPTSDVSADQAAVMIRELEKTGPGCTLEQRSAGVRLLLEHAPGLTVEQMRRLAIRVRDRLDEDGTEPREEVHRRRRSLTITTTRDGMTHIDWYLDAVSAGQVVPAITAYVSRDFHDTRHQPVPKAGVLFEDTEPTPPEMPEMPETRSLAQLRSDGAVEVFRHRAGCSTGATSPPVTMIVRVALADLRSGKGAAEIDEVPTPISASTARRLAADAHLIPMVLGHASEVLDLGRKQRLFSPAQKHALAERDGGCAWTGCPHPPAYTQAHHIRWWDRDTGPTDLDNGILLCTHHHHRVHDDGWLIQVRQNTPWFTPPAHLDPTRTPRKGGRIRVPDSAPP